VAAARHEDQRDMVAGLEVRLADLEEKVFGPPRR